MPGTDEVTLRLSRWLLVMPFVIAVQGVTLTRLFQPFPFLLLTPAGLLCCVLLWRQRTTLRPDGVEVVGLLRRRRVPWADVAAVEQSRGCHLRTRAGERLALPGVGDHPVVPERYLRRGTAQWVVAYAREHGADLELRPA